VSALRGEGRADLLDAMTAQLALDTRRVTFEFDPDSAPDRLRIAALYRHARIVRHLTTDGRVAIEADVPRRLLDRFETRDALTP